MLIDKPPWLSHGGQSILSIDVQPCGDRVATAGLDYKVKIWNLIPVLNTFAEADPSVPRLLSTLGDHFGPVNVARFAKKTNLLASGSDDNLVCIYELREGPGTQSFGSAEGRSLENWKVVHSCQGHRNNVTDLAWSPDDALLATCSLDNKIIVWDVKTGHVRHKLEDHASYVKGLAWDPIGNYLASESDDRSVIVWKTADWTQVRQITEPFVPPNTFVSNTFSLRIDWSPDGSILAAVNSFQTPKHTAPLIDRQTWQSQFSLVGHNGAVLCAKYSPQMYHRDMHDGQLPKLANCVALGGQDRKVSVWENVVSRPVCVVGKLFKQGPVDISWTQDGRTLLACSPDGTVAVLQFTLEELGQPIPQEAMEEHIEKLYGDIRSRPTILPESAEQLQLEAEARASKPASSGGVGTAEALAGRLAPPPSRPAPPAARQARGPSDGHRRIEALPVAGDGIASASRPVGAPATGKGTAIAEGSLQAGSRQGVAGQALPTQTAPRTGADRLQQPLSGGARPQVGEKRRGVALETDRPAKQTVQASIAAPNHAQAASPLRTEMLSGSAQAPVAVSAVVPLPAQAGLLFVNLGEEDEDVLPSGVARRHRTLEATNIAGSGNGTVRVTCSSQGKQAWSDLLLGQASAVGGSLQFAAVGLTDGSLVVYSRMGRRVLPALQLGAAPAIMSFDAELLLVICVDGGLHLWDLNALQLRTSTSVIPLLGRPGSQCKGGMCSLVHRVAKSEIPVFLSQPCWAVTVIKARLSKNGSPLVVLSNCTASLYHLGMKTWMRVADSGFPSSAFASILPSATTGELARLEGDASTSAPPHGPPNLALWQKGKSQSSRAHLETRIAAALVLESPAEYRRWLLTYARHLADEQDSHRLREVCEELLGPLRPAQPSEHVTTQTVEGWSSTFLGLDKRQLLKELLRDISRNRALQRLVADFQDLLKEAEKGKPLL